MSLRPFLNRHSGETAWLFGKGPSLSTFDFKKAGPLRAAINDVIAHIPECTYGFANDGVKPWKDAYRKGQTLFQPERCMGEYDSRIPGSVACDVVTYKDFHDDERMSLSRHDLAELAAIRRGTLGSALQILHVMGVRAVHLVGIDGGGTHAPGYEWKTRLRADHAKDYDAIRSAAIDAAFIMGIALKFHNHDHTMETDGKVFVKMDRNCMAEAKPYCLGEIASFSPRVAAELVSVRAAHYWEPPTKKQDSPIETAEKPMDSVESAVIKTRKSSRK